jgi:hypothetical protein
MNSLSQVLSTVMIVEEACTAWRAHVVYNRRQLFPIASEYTNVLKQEPGGLRDQKY